MTSPFVPGLRSLISAILIASATLASVAAEPPFAGPVVAGTLAAPPKNETSGIAASRRNPDLLWVHDDSGGKPFLHAVSTTGALRGSLQIGGGVKNEDWEDIAAVELDGKAWLVIADVGDNDAQRRDLRVHLVEEPSADRLAIAGMLAQRPTATFRLRYEDGPRDCESIAVDARERMIYLLTKRNTPPRLYRFPLPSPLQDGEVVARFVTSVPHLPPPTALQARLPGHLGKRRAQPCAMDFATDGSAAVALTYGDVVLYPRRPGETWGVALAREPIRLAEHNLPQTEAACFSPDGQHIFVASESSRTLLRYDRR